MFVADSRLVCNGFGWSFVVVVGVCIANKVSTRRGMTGFDGKIYFNASLSLKGFLGRKIGIQRK